MHPGNNTIRRRVCTLKTAPVRFGFPKEQKPEEIAPRFRPCSPFLAEDTALVIVAVSFRPGRGNAFARNIDAYLWNACRHMEIAASARIRRTSIDRTARIANGARLFRSVGVVPRPRRPVSKCRRRSPPVSTRLSNRRNINLPTILSYHRRLLNFPLHPVIFQKNLDDLKQQVRAEFERSYLPH